MTDAGPSVAVISNPLSRRNRRGLNDINAALAGRGGVRHHVLERFDALPGLLARLADNGTGYLVVNGGDGTVHAVLGELFSGSAQGLAPALAVLAGGTSNTIAGDVGLKGERGAALARLLDAIADNRAAALERSRAVLRVDYGAARPVHGMLFGAAGITRGIRTHRRLMPWPWLPDPVATVMMLGLLLGSQLVNGRIAREVLEGETVRLRIDDAPAVAEHYSVLLASTLERIVLGSCPFWGSGDGPLRFSAVRYPPARLVRSLPRFLFGPQHGLPAGYASWNARRVQLRLDSAFVLDGEFYEPPAGGEVILSADEQVRFLCV